MRKEKWWAGLSLGCLGSVAVATLAVGCGQGDGRGTLEATESTAEAVTGSVIQHVFVIAMENHDASEIYGSSNAPYINGTLLADYAHATNFNDPLALSIPSEPHYVWMEAGTNAFSDHTFTGDSDPSRTNSTNSTAHLVTQIKNATNGATWRSYQEGLNSSTGACPIHSNSLYAAKHNPFVFFQDVSGNPPSATNSYCESHHRAYSAFASDLTAGDVAGFTFITPNLCHDMHGASGCPSTNNVTQGDTWLSQELPRILTYAHANAGVVFIVWDEGDSTLKIPFIAAGPGVKTGYAGSVSYTHSSLLKSIERILGLPTLSKVSSANDLSDLFMAGQYP
jgi:hypothetical protein